MKKYDKELILKSILKVTFIMIIISTFLKLLGLNVFNLDLDNKIINYPCDFLLKFKLTYFVLLAFIFFNSFIILRLCCENKNRSIYYLSALNIIILNYTANFLFSSNIGHIYYSLFNTLLLIIFASIINKKLTIIKPLLISTVITIYYIINLFLRNVKFDNKIDFIYMFLLNIDYVILILITYYGYLIKVSESDENYSFYHLKLDNLFLKVKENLYQIGHNFVMYFKNRKKDKIPALYKILNLSVIIFIAFLNNSQIECLLILSSFLIAKNFFRKSYRFNSVSQYFIASNLIYYILNRITFDIGISLVIPISLGVILSYFDNLISAKKEEIKLYRGMKENTLRDIGVDNNLNSVETDLLVDFYSNKMSLVELSSRYNYSKDAIWKKKKAAIKKLKRQ